MGAGAGMGLVGMGWVGASWVGAGCRLGAQMHSLRSEKGNGMSFQISFLAVPTATLPSGRRHRERIDAASCLPGRIGRLEEILSFHIPPLCGGKGVMTWAAARPYLPKRKGAWVAEKVGLGEAAEAMAEEGWVAEMGEGGCIRAKHSVSVVISDVELLALKVPKCFLGQHAEPATAAWGFDQQCNATRWLDMVSDRSSGAPWWR